MTQGQGYKANDVFAPEGAWQTSVSASKKCLGYESFGSLLPGRNYSSDSYRFGFNGMEKDDEMQGATGTSYTTEFRQLDPRLGRWLSIDPLAQKYAGQSPYASFNNNPIYFNDPLGLEGDPPTTEAFTVPDSPEKVNTDVWKELAPDEGIERGHTQRWQNTETGQTLAFDRGKPGATGWEGKDHFHVYDKDGKRLTADGKVSTNSQGKYAKSANRAHLLPGQKTQIRVPTAASILKAVPKVAKGAMKVLVPVGAAISIYDIATAEDKPKAIVTEASGWAGAWAGVEVGAAGGAAVGVWFAGAGAVPGAIIGGIIGGIAGYIGGSAAGEAVYEAATE